MANNRPDTPLAKTPDAEYGKKSTEVKSDTIKHRDVPLAETKVKGEFKSKDSQSGNDKYSSKYSSYTEVTKPDNSKNTEYAEQNGKKYKSTFVTRDSSGKATAAQKEVNGKIKYTDNPSKIERWESKFKK